MRGDVILERRISAGCAELKQDASLSSQYSIDAASEIIKRIRLLFKKGTLERGLVDVNEVVREMIVLLRGEAIVRLSRLICETLDKLPFPEDVAVAVDVDPYQLL